MVTLVLRIFVIVCGRSHSGTCCAQGHHSTRRETSPLAMLGHLGVMRRRQGRRTIRIRTDTSPACASGNPPAFLGEGTISWTASSISGGRSPSERGMWGVFGMGYGKRIKVAIKFVFQTTFFVKQEIGEES